MKADVHVGRNGCMHHVKHRDAGPSILEKIRRDNVGKVHLPAGTDNNLQRPAEGASRRVCGRALDWRMSWYERRRRRNGLRGAAGQSHGEGNTGPVQRSSGHLAVPGAARTQSRGSVDPRSRNEPGGKPLSSGAYASRRLSFFGNGQTSRGKPRSEPDSGNPTVRDRRGARGNVAHGRTRNPLSIPKGLYWKLSA